MPEENEKEEVETCHDCESNESETCTNEKSSCFGGRVTSSVKACGEYKEFKTKAQEERRE